MTVAPGFFEIEGQQYYGYETHYFGEITCTGFFSYQVLEKLSTGSLEDNTSLLSNIVPPKGSSVCVIPQCPLPMDEIRKNYTIKRNVDTAEYNVFSGIPTPWSRGCSTGACFIAFDINKKIAYLSAPWASQKEAFLSAILLENGSYQRIYKLEQHTWESRIVSSDINPAYVELLNGNLKKPCVFYKNLNLSSNLDLTQDVLQLTYELGRKWASEKDASKNLKIQLMALSNYNWRKYPKTLDMLLNRILRVRGGVYTDLRSRPSTLPKPIGQIIKCVDNFDRQMTPEEKEKDLELGRTFLKNLLNINDTMYVSTNDLISKLKEKNIFLFDFENFFSCITRITVKQPKDEQAT